MPVEIALPIFGVYLNLVEDRLWVPVVGGSNPLTPTKNKLNRWAGKKDWTPEGPNVRKLAAHRAPPRNLSAGPVGRSQKSGALWAVNTMVRVNDQVCGIHETLWIESRKFTFSPDAGSTTEIECWRPSSFEI